MLDYIDEKLALTWSPEQIANTPCELKIPSFKTIYRWIYERCLKSTLKQLRRKGKTRKRLGTAEDLPRVNLYGKEIKAYISDWNSDIGKPLLWRSSI